MAISRPLLLLITLLFTIPSQGAQDVYSFAIVPQQAATKLARDWSPLLAHVSEVSGVRLAFATAPSIPEFERRLALGEYDFAYMNPYHYTVFSSAPGYRAIARQLDKRIRGLIVVAKDAPIETLAQLDDQAVAYPAPAAFAATLLPRAHMKAEGIEDRPVFVGSHDSVYRNVAANRVAAGGGIERTLNALAPEIRSMLRVLWTTPGFTPHAIAAHPRVPTDVTAAVAAALAELESTDVGKELLEPLKIKRLGPASDADWDDVRALTFQPIIGGSVTGQ